MLRQSSLAKTSMASKADIVCSEREVTAYMEYVLKTTNLGRTYRNFKALDGLSMRVPKGAIYGMVGKNGAGKTTLIRLLCGLQEPTSGGYELYGKKNTDRDILKVRRRMGAIVESPSVYMDMTARDNMRQQYRILGLPSFDGIEETLQMVGLGGVGKKKAKHFSLGMRQRLGIAIALAGSPDFLVLDEPVNGLDPQGIIEIRELILKLNRERQITVLISSHILDELSRVATHYGFIDGGRIVKEISAEELEAETRKCTRVEVSDTRILARALDEKNVEYRIYSDTEADIYESLPVTRLALFLQEKNCEIFSMRERDESLESYYINLVGSLPEEGRQK